MEPGVTVCSAAWIVPQLHYHRRPHGMGDTLMLRLLGYALPRAAWAGGLALAMAQPAGAQTPAPAQAPSALQRWHVRYDLGPDGRATMTQELHHQVLQAGALEELKTYSVGFSNGIQQGQVLEAYTLKRLFAPSQRTFANLTLAQRPPDS